MVSQNKIPQVLERLRREVVLKVSMLFLNNLQQRCNVPGLEIHWLQLYLFEFSIHFLKNGITDPRDPTTLPYRTTENDVPCGLPKEFAAINNLSEHSFVAP